MIPTFRTYILLTFVGLLAATIAALWRGEHAVRGAIGLMLLLDLGVLVAALMDAWAGRNGRATVARSPLSRLSIGRDNIVTLEVQAGNRSTDLHIRDAYPLEHFTVSTEQLTTNLAPHESKTLSYTVKPTLRGSYPWGKIQVRQRSPWGLVWMDWKTGNAEKVDVFPDLIALRSLTIKLTLQSAGSVKQSRKFGIGTEFAELREYNVGDDPRLMDWKATARRSRPFVRVLEPEREQTLIILLDRGRLMTASVEGLQRFDWGLNAALALAMTGIKRGDRVGVAVFDRSIHTWIPPQRGDRHFTYLLEKLTPIQPDLTEPDYVSAVSNILSQQTRRALVVMITDLVDTTASSELLASLAKLTPRYLPFCVTLRDPEIDRIANSSPNLASSNLEGNGVANAYARSVALDLLAQRQVAFAELTRKGVLVLDAPANQISDQLVDRYLTLKLRNQL